MRFPRLRSLVEALRRRSSVVDSSLEGTTRVYAETNGGIAPIKIGDQRYSGTIYASRSRGVERNAESSCFFFLKLNFV